MPITETSAGIISSGSNDGFGTQVAVANGTLLISAPDQNASGGGLSAFKGAGTSWILAQTIVPNGGSTAFAQALGLSSDGTIAAVAGTPGTVSTDWLFQKMGQNWFQLGNPLLPPLASTTFAEPVAVDGNTIVAAGFFAAYVYSTTGGAPQVLAPSDFTPNDTNGFFGAPIAISGDTILVVGQPFDSQGQLGHFVYVFGRSGATWTQQAKLIPSDLFSNAGPAFRFSVATDGNSAVVATTFGAYVFTRSGTSWPQTQMIPAPASSNLSPVAFAGNLMVIGNANFIGDAGSAFVYGRSQGTWIAGPTLSTGVGGDSFANSVAVGQGTIAIGAPTTRGNGAVHVYSCAP